MAEFYDDFWREHKLAEGETGYWKIGPLQLWITRFSNEWRTVDLQSRDYSDQSMIIQLPFAGDPPQDKNLRRFGVSKTTEILKFIPILADRSMVIRPEMPFYILENEQINLYMSTSLWMKIECAEKGKPIVELPIFRPSDTWFGEDPTQGELCYAAKISAKLRFRDLMVSRYRAYTKISIRNSAKEPLFLERVKLPVVNLSLYKSEAGLFFTDNILVVRENNEGRFNLDFEKPTMQDFGNLEKIAGPKKFLNQSIFSRTIRSLIS